MLKERYYTGNSGERRRGQQCLLLLVPVVLPYMASAFGLKGVSADIIGTDGLDEKMQRRTLTINQK
jgi:hypothetical protein